jgi:eukaryotic-like serine/threonine-protein kinase
VTQSLEPERWAEVEHAFDALIDLTPARQAERLAAIDQADPRLRQLIERLIAADANGGGRLAQIESLLIAGAGKGVEPVDDLCHLTGRTVSHFRVHEPLARGGMGIVYRAEDVELGRDVALKIPLPVRSSDRGGRERFRREARAAAALDHPNICSIYEIGETDHGQLFIAMPLYSGETLRDRLARDGPLPVEDAVAIARQIALGLDGAHQKGIVHRDLKPANVMLLSDGTVRILDFGLAKAQEVTLTTSRTFLGTVSYMAPEHIRGESVDARTDLWSLGVVLFEMVTGTRPFAGEHEISVAHAILHAEPGLASASARRVPPALDALIAALLQKEASRRGETAARIVAALDAVREGTPEESVAVVAHPAPRRRFATVSRLTAGCVAAVLALAALWLLRADDSRADRLVAPSIAVLPFDKASGDSASDHISEGFSDELAGILGTVEGLRVTRLASSAQPNAATGGRTSATALPVSALLRGSIRRDGGRLRVTSELVDAGSGRSLWKDTYDRTMGELSAVHAEIAAGATAALGIPRGRLHERTERRRTHDVEAYDLYMRGRHEWRSRSREGLEAAIVYYEQAIERDPLFALPYAGLAEAYVNVSNYGHDAVGQPLVLARVAADRAIALDSDVAEAHASRGYVMAANLELDNAEQAFQRALALNPNYLWARHYYTLLLLMKGRSDAAREQNRAALSLDPLSRPANATRGIILAQEGRLVEATHELRQAQTLAPEYGLTLFYLGALQAAQGDVGESRRTLEAASKAAPTFPGVPGALAHVYQRTGRAAAADSIIADLRQRVDDPRGLANLAFALAALGHLDEAFPLLERARWDVPSVIELRADPLLQNLRADARYARLLQRIVG